MLISLFHFCEKVFTLMNIWIIGKNAMKHHCFNKSFYSHLNMEDIMDADYTKILKRISWFVCWKGYFIVSRCIWELSKNVSLNIWTWLCFFPYCTRIRMANSNKKGENKIRWLLMVERGIRGGIWQAIHQYAEANIK